MGQCPQRHDPFGPRWSFWQVRVPEGNQIRHATLLEMGETLATTARDANIHQALGVMVQNGGKRMWFLGSRCWEVAMATMTQSIDNGTALGVTTEIARKGLGQGVSCVCSGRAQGGKEKNTGGRALFGPTHLRLKFGGRIGRSAQVGPFRSCHWGMCDLWTFHVDHFEWAKTGWVAALEIPSALIAKACPLLQLLVPRKSMSQARHGFLHTPISG
jgi:hypothetical protein